MLVKEAMVTEVVSIDKNKSIFDACQIYKKFKIGCLLVTDSERCVGIVTERNIIERTICEHKDPENTKIYEIMSSDIKTINPLNTLEEAVIVMNKNNVKKLPVIQNDDIVGIITVTDISRAQLKSSDRYNESDLKTMWED